MTLSVTDQARRLARAMTWFTLGMEAILALLVLVPWASARRASGTQGRALRGADKWAIHAEPTAVDALPVERPLVGLFVVLPVVAVSSVRILTALDRILGHEGISGNLAGEPAGAQCGDDQPAARVGGIRLGMARRAEHHQAVEIESPSPPGRA